MNILAAYVHWPLSAAQHYVAAFRRLGHTVQTVGPILTAVKPNGYWGVENDEWWPTYQIGEYDKSGWAYVPVETILDQIDETPDLIITPSGFFTLSGSSPIPHVLISFEPLAYNRGYDVVEDTGWTHEFTADPQSKRLVEDTCYYLPMGYDPMLHREIIPFRQRPVEMTFTGILYDERLAFAQSLLHRGVLMNAARGIDFKQYVTLTNSGRTTINIPNHVNTGLSNRVFEAMAMGTVYLSPPYPVLAEAGLIDGTHYLSYQTEDDVLAHIERIREGPEYGEAIVAHARAWVLGQTYDARCGRILEVVCGN